MTAPATPVFWHAETAGDAWDRLVLAGKTWPGICDISGTGAKRDLSIKKTKGKDGATVSDSGTTLAKIKITITIWTKDQWNELLSLLPLIHPRRKGGGRDPITIVHPKTQLFGITAVYIESIPMPQLSNDGIGKVEINAIEWIPSPKKVKRGAKYRGGTAKGAKNTKKGPSAIRGAVDAYNQFTSGVLGALEDAFTGD